MIKKADLTKAHRCTPGCRTRKAMKEGGHSRTNLAHSAACRARMADILLDDVEFRANVERAEERRGMEPFPEVQKRGSSSSGSAPVLWDLNSSISSLSNGATCNTAASLAVASTSSGNGRAAGSSEDDTRNKRRVARVTERSETPGDHSGPATDSTPSSSRQR